MALWGNKDAGIGTAPAAHATQCTLTLNYATREIVGTATTFGRVGAGKTGDIIEIGSRAPGATYFGSATIVGIASTTAITIGSTSGLNGDAISGVTFYKVRECPTSVEVDSSFSTRNDSASSLNKIGQVNISSAVTLNDNAGVGRSVFPVSKTDQGAENGIGLIVGDSIDTNTGNLVVSKVNDAVVTALAGVAIGETTFRFAPPPGMTHGQFIQDQSGSVVGFGSTTAVALVGQGATTNYITISNLAAHNILAGDTILTPNIAAAVAIGTVNVGVNTISLVAGATGGTITAGMAITFFSNTIVTLSKGADIAINTGLGVTVMGDDNAAFVSFETKTGSAISAGTGVTVNRHQGGYDRHVYGVAGAGLTASGSSTAGDKFIVDHSGWVGVTTYVDNAGNLRVKKEVLVAMSGITTANTPIYPAYPPNPPAAN
jgi:hypothetical protein